MSDLLPLDPTDPPLTDDDLEAWAAWEEIDTFDEVSGEPLPLPPAVEKVIAWSVCDTGTAEWALRRLAHAEARLREVEAEADRFHAQIDRWLTGEAKAPRQAVNFFTGQLTTYARRKREEEGLKTLNLPSGAVSSKLVPARPEVTEKDAFVAWARKRELPVVKAKWEPVMAEVAKHVLFRTVCFPVTQPYAEQVHDVDDFLVVLPASVQEPEEFLGGMNMADLLGEVFDERPNTAIYRREDGSWWLVPGVAEVPAYVKFTVRPDLP